MEDAQARAHIAGGIPDAEAQATAEQEASDAAEDLARLAVADAARREWTEAHAEQAAKAEAAARELQARGLDARVIPVTDAEQAAAEAQERDEPTVARIDPEAAAQWRAEQTARVEASQARHAESARRIPVADAEVAKYAAEPQLEFSDSSGRHSGEGRTPELDEIEATMAEMRGEVEALAADLGELAARDAEAEAARAVLRWTRRASTSRCSTSRRPRRNWTPRGSLAPRRPTPRRSQLRMPNRNSAPDGLQQGGRGLQRDECPVSLDSRSGNPS